MDIRDKTPENQGMRESSVSQIKVSLEKYFKQ